MHTPATDLTDKDRVRAIAAAIICVAIVGIGLSLSIPLLSLEMERMGVSGTWIGINTAVAGIASIVTVPFVPAIAAKVGVMRLLWICIATVAVSIVGFKLLFDFVWWFPLRFIFSAALGALFVLSEFWINAVAPPERRGLVMGIYATVLALGFAVGPAVLIVAGTEGWAPYVACAALFLVAAIPLLFASGLTPSLDEKPTRSVASFILVAPAATLAALVFGAVETGGFALLPVYGLRLGLTPESAAALVSIVALGNVVLQIPLGLLSDRIDRRLILLGVSLLGALGAAAIPAASDNAITLYPLLFVWGGVIGGLYTVGLAHLGARFSGADLASANAAFVVLYNVGLVVGPPSVGAGMDIIPPHGFAFVLAAYFAAYVVIVAIRSRRGA